MLPVWSSEGSPLIPLTNAERIASGPQDRRNQNAGQSAQYDFQLLARRETLQATWPVRDETVRSHQYAKGEGLRLRALGKATKDKWSLSGHRTRKAVCLVRTRLAQFDGDKRYNEPTVQVTKTLKMERH